MAGKQDFADLLESRNFRGSIEFAHGLEPRRGARILAAKAPGARINPSWARFQESRVSTERWHKPSSVKIRTEGRNVFALTMR
jgi:hypothetical protein